MYVVSVQKEKKLSFSLNPIRAFCRGRFRRSLFSLNVVLSYVWSEIALARVQEEGEKTKENTRKEVGQERREEIAIKGNLVVFYQRRRLSAFK